MVKLEFVRAAFFFFFFLESPAITSGPFEAAYISQSSENILGVLFESNIHLT